MPPPATETTPTLPERCTAADIAAVLAAAAQPSSWLLLRDPLEPIAGPVTIITATLWRVELWRLANGRLTFTMSATSPDGATWSHGCQRHWTTTGEVIEPLELLKPEQCQQLSRRLEHAACMPLGDAPTSQQVTVPFPERVQAKRRPKRRAA